MTYSVLLVVINIAETEILTSSYRLTANTLALSYFSFCRHQFGFCHAFSFKVNDFRRGSRINADRFPKLAPKAQASRAGSGNMHPLESVWILTGIRRLYAFCWFTVIMKSKKCHQLTNFRKCKPSSTHYQNLFPLKIYFPYQEVKVRPLKTGVDLRGYLQ